MKNIPEACVRESFGEYVRQDCFQVLGLDNCNFVVIYGLASSIYYDKLRIADMVKKELLDRAMRQFISEQVMTLSQLEPLLSCSQRSVQRYRISLNVVGYSRIWV